MLNNYIINDSTLALVPKSGNITKVYEKYASYDVLGSPFTIIDESCKFYGSSFSGRCQSTNYLIGVKYKCPVIISEVKDIVAFPTLSYTSKDCMWFIYSGVSGYYVDNKSLKIILTTGVIIETNLSENIFTQQLFKAARLMTVMKSKKY